MSLADAIVIVLTLPIAVLASLELKDRRRQPREPSSPSERDDWDWPNPGRVPDSSGDLGKQ